MNEPSEARRSRGAGTAGAGALAALIALVLFGGHGGASGAVGQGDAYSRFVTEHFIDARLLVLNTDPDSGAPIVDLAPEVYASPDGVLFQYAAQSHLLQDIRRNDARLWRIENGIVTGIQAGHSTPPPFPRPTGDWRGTLRYREAVASTTHRTIELDGGPGAPLLILTPDAGPTGTGDPDVTTLSPSDRLAGRPLEAAGFDIECEGPGGGAVSIRRIGEEVAVRTPAGSACVVDIGPTRLDAGQPGFEILARGERLTIHGDRGGGLTFQRRFLTPDFGRLSAPGAGGARYRAGELASWSAAFERDLGRALAGDSLPPGDIETTLDRELQLGAQAILDDHFSGLEDSSSIGAITIMDALTGEVLAMASTPRPGAGPDETFLDLDDSLEGVRRRNQNLARLPVGSAVKPLMAAAILQRQPELLTLQIRGQESASDLLGYPFQRPLSNHPAPAWVDFDAFIQGSDNLYAAALTLLGSADVNGQQCRLDPEQGYRMGLAGEAGADQIRTTRPKSVFETADANGRCRPALLEHDRQLRWADTLEDLFDIESGFGQAETACGASPDDRIRASPWASLLNRYNRVDLCGFRESTPEIETLGLAGRLDFRTGAIPIILGNGDGRWSTIGLAQAYARLVTGERVTATFMPNAATQATPLGLDPDVRLALTHALTLVPRGTAANTGLPGALGEAEALLQARGLVLGAFAKTGTPIIASSRYRPTDQAINSLIRFDRIRLASGTGALLIRTASGQHVLTGSSDEARRREVIRAIAADPVALEALQRAPGTTVASVVARLIHHLQAMREGQSPFIIQSGNGGRLLVRVASRDDIIGGAGGEDDPSGKVIALVVAAYSPERSTGLRIDELGRAWDGRARPQRAYAVVVNIQRESAGGNAAADLAGRVVEELLARRLAGRGSV